MFNEAEPHRRHSLVERGNEKNFHCVSKKNTWRLEIAAIQTKSACADLCQPAEAGFVCVAPDFQSVSAAARSAGDLPKRDASD